MEKLRVGFGLMVARGLEDGWRRGGVEGGTASVALLLGLSDGEEVLGLADEVIEQSAKGRAECSQLGQHHPPSARWRT